MGDLGMSQCDISSIMVARNESNGFRFHQLTKHDGVQYRARARHPARQGVAPTTALAESRAGEVRPLRRPAVARAGRRDRHREWGGGRLPHTWRQACRPSRRAAVSGEDAASVGTAPRRRSMRSSRPCLVARSQREMCVREPTRWRWPMRHELSGNEHRCAVNRTDAPFGPAASGRRFARHDIPRREVNLGHPEGAEERRRTRRACSRSATSSTGRASWTPAPCRGCSTCSPPQTRPCKAPPRLSFSYSNIWVLLSSSSNFLLLGL